MPLTPGDVIGPYRVDREIGRGGMGVVFLAHDTRLGRAVALKALPEDVASDADRLQRFEREARVLASLNHPNVAAIYGLEESDGRRYLALERIDGETLADRLTRGPLPLSETLDLGIQIAAGMEAAHDGGVVHRDLKPANVMITNGDVVKILDFGLAKGRVVSDESGLAKSPAMIDSPAQSSPTLAHSPTVISPPTIPGVILGTASYLSPEQARGKVVDRRTDIWSFGCVLYECLTGRRLFEGETVSDTIAMILARDVDLSGLPSATPPRLRELLERCLTRDHKSRLRDMGDARITLEELRSGRHPASAQPAASARPAGARRTVVLVVAAALLGAALGVAAWSIGPGARFPRQAVAHLALALPRDVRFAGGEISSDGRTIAFIGVPLAESLPPRIYVRSLERPEFRQLPGTEGAISFVMDPRGRWLQFRASAGGQSNQTLIFKVATDGSTPPIRLWDARTDWSTSAVMLHSGDVIVGTTNGHEFFRLPAGGGNPTPPRPFDAPDMQNARFAPLVPALPGDRGVFLNAAWYEGGVYRQGIAVLDLKSNRVKRVLVDGGHPHYSDTGHLLFTRQDALMAIPFDLNRLEAHGEPIAVMGGLRSDQNWVHASFGLSESGVLTYFAGGNVTRDRQLVFVDRDGSATDWSSEREAFEYSINASPKGDRCVVEITNENAITELWISARGASSLKRIPAPAGVDCGNGVWSPDGSQIAFWQVGNTAADGIYVVPSDGSSAPRHLAARPTRTAFLRPCSWSPDGTTLIAMLADSGMGSLVSIPINSKDGEVAKPALIRRRGFAPGLSPDGRCLAFVSGVGGRTEVFVSAWDGAKLVGQPVQITSSGGRAPRWAREGRSLYYVTRQQKLMAVDIRTEPTLLASHPRQAWDLSALRVPTGVNDDVLYDTLPGGRIVAVRRSENEDTPTHAEIVLHFTEEMEQKFRAARK